jgi:hypothetical protein
MILSQVDGIWHLRVRLGASADLQLRTCLETGAQEEAIFRAERIYADFKRRHSSKAEDRVLCWQCIHWLPVKADCSFGWPEARQTGGRFAAQCSVFKASGHCSTDRSPE